MKLQKKIGRELVWSDEFDENELDLQKWGHCRLMHNPDTMYENTEKHIKIEDSKLHLQVHRCGEKFSNCEAVTTKNTMLFKYGYVEMRAKLPYRHGAWPSFWMKGDTAHLRTDWFPETDIFEVFSSNGSLGANLHKWGPLGHEMIQGDENNPKRGYTFENTETLNDEYHIYGLEWTPEAMKFYVDDNCYYTAVIGEKTSFVSENYPDVKGFHDPQYLIINNEIFTEGLNWYPEGASINDSDELPFDYYIDWVRLYQNTETEKIYLGKDILSR